MSLLYTEVDLGLPGDNGGPCNGSKEHYLTLGVSSVVRLIHGFGLTSFGFPPTPSSVSIKLHGICRDCPHDLSISCVGSTNVPGAVKSIVDLNSLESHLI